MNQPAQILISAGDYSGNVHGAAVTAALLKQAEAQGLPRPTIWALGGDAMADAGATLIGHQRHLGTVGLGFLWALPAHFLAGFRILWACLSQPIQTVLFIDYGGFHLRMASLLTKLKRLGILPQSLQLHYYIPPQVWASRPGRLQVLKKTIAQAYVIFPFEVDLYAKAGIPATYVGHPLLSQLPPPTDKATLAARYGLDSARPIVGLLPGSRRMEMDYLLPVMVTATAQLLQAWPTDKPWPQFLLALAPTFSPEAMVTRLATLWTVARNEHATLPATCPIQLITNDTAAVQSGSDALWIASGTATLEAALYGTPMVIVYKGHPLAAIIFRWLCQLPVIGLPNILTTPNSPPVVEYLQEQCTPENLVAGLIPLLDATSPELQRQQAALQSIRSALHNTPAPAAETVAQALLSRHV